MAAAFHGAPAVTYHRRRTRRPVPVVALAVLLLGGLLGAQLVLGPPGGATAATAAGAATTAAATTAASAGAPTGSAPTDGAPTAVLPAAAVTVRFEVGSLQPLPQDAALLDDLVARAAADPGVTVLVTGHSDASNDPALEQQIAEQRAFAVAGLLVERGLAPERATVVAAGAAEAAQAGEEGNRRVVVEVVAD